MRHRVYIIISLALLTCSGYNSGKANILSVPGEYSTITSAISAASSGDTISIAADEYDEEFIIEKDLVFLGAGWNSTIIKTSASYDEIMTINNSVVTVKDIQFWGTGSGPFWTARAIVANNSTLTISDCKFVHLGNFGIRIYDGYIDAHNIQMINTNLYTDIGIQVWNSTFNIDSCYGGNKIDHIIDIRGVSSGIIENNTIDGSNVHWAQGIRLMDSANATVRNNVIIGQHDSTTVSPNQPAGIAMHDDAFADIYRNEIQGFVNGLYLSNNATAKVYNNIITNNARVGVRSNHDWYNYNGATPDLGGGAHASPGNNLIRDNADYNVENNSSQTIFAMYNHWNSYDSIEIDNSIYDNEEDITFGEVIFTPLGYVCGDADGTGAINILDVTCLINYLYKGGLPPDPIESGDANGSGNINLLDVTYLINYLYKGGPAPVCQ